MPRRLRTLWRLWTVGTLMWIAWCAVRIFANREALKFFAPEDYARLALGTALHVLELPFAVALPLALTTAIAIGLAHLARARSGKVEPVLRLECAREGKSRARSLNASSLNVP